MGKEDSTTKMYTKDENDNGYSVERKKAQSLTFSKIQELLQRNVSKQITKSYTKYTRDLLDTYAQSPINNLDNIREVSRFLTRVSMVYRQILEYFSTMPLYTYNITPILDMTKDITTDKSIKDYQSVLSKLQTFNMAKELQNVLYTVLRDGMYVGMMYDSEEDGMFLMPLDVQYCRIYGKTPDGEWIVHFNAAYFDSGDNKDYLYGIDEDGVGTWDPIFVEGYEAFKQDRNSQWFRLPPEYTFCMIASSDDEFYVPLPKFLPLFKSLLQLLDTENIVAAKTELQNYKLILNKIPLLSGDDTVDDFAVSLELANYFQQALQNIVPDLVGVGLSPFDSEVVDFEKSTSTDDTDTLSQSMNNLFSNAGVNKLIVGSGDSSNANGIKYSIANDLGKMNVYLKKAESWLNHYIKLNVSDGYKLEIFEQTQYNKEDFINQKKEAATFGGSKMDYLCALGDTPYIAYNKLRFESQVLNMQQFMNPLQTSYTQPGTAAVGNTGGAPEKDESDLSDEGQATRDSGKNDDKGNA